MSDGITRLNKVGDATGIVHLRARLESAPGKAADEPAISEEGGDLGGGIIRGVRVVSLGEAQGHGFRFDEHGLDEVIKLGIAAGADGVRCQYTHSWGGFFSEEDPITTHLGVFKGFARTADGVRADLHLDPAASKVPKLGDIRGYVLARAKSSPGLMGASMAVDGDTVEVEGEEDELPAYRARALHSIDIVGRPAANPSLLSAKEQKQMADTKDEASRLKTELEESRKLLQTERENLAKERDLLKIERAKSEAIALGARARAAEAEFDKAFSEEGGRKVVAAERSFWLGELDADNRVMLDADGKPKAPGIAITFPDLFTRYVATQSRKHGGPIEGGSGAPPGGAPSAFGAYQKAIADRVAALRAENKDIPDHIAAADAAQYVAANQPEIHRAYRQSLPGRA